MQQLVNPIKYKLRSVTGHSVEVVPTGSVFERYGKPLAAPAIETNLRTDYDIMFCLNRKDLPIEVLMKNDEFLHIFVLSPNCSLLNSIKKEHQEAEAVKLSASKARQFMMDIVESVKLKEKERDSRVKLVLWNILAYVFNLPRMGR